MKLPASFQPYVFGLVLSGVMSFMVSGIATANAVGLADGFFAKWIGSWLFAWAVAFPTVLFVRPFAQRVTALIVAAPEAPAR
jgi:hypothetical protein